MSYMSTKKPKKPPRTALRVFSGSVPGFHLLVPAVALMPLPLRVAVRFRSTREGLNSADCHGKPAECRGKSRISFEHERVVPRHDARVVAPRQFAQAVERVVHRVKVVDDRERPVLREV